MARTLEQTYAEMEVYIDKLKGRMKAGHEEYGDVSFSKDPEETIEELQEELLDVSGWGFILWQRLEIMKEALKCLTSEKETS
jgi:hypothetical protein